MKAYIAGVAGFLGSHLAERLVKEGWEVHGADDLSYGRPWRVPEGVHWTQADLSTGLPKMVSVDIIFNCAAHARTMDVELEPTKSYAANVTVTERLAQHAMLTGTRFVHASSCIVFGNQCTYKRQKDYAELRAITITEQAVCLRFANMYGCHQSEEGDHPNVLAAFKRAQRRGEKIPVDGDGEQTRDFLHISDGVEAMILAGLVKMPNVRTLSVCTGIQTSILSAALCFGEVEHRPARLIDTNVIYQSNAQAERFLGFKPQVYPLAGIQAYADA